MRPRFGGNAIPPLRTIVLMVMQIANREEYLSTLVDRMRPWFAQVGLRLPDVIRVSVGFPSKRAVSARDRAIGQCFAPAVSVDESVQIFISPVIGNGLRAADVLVHELCHAAVGMEHGHTWPFRRAARAMGLEGKPTATIAGRELADRLNTLLAEIGLYPHPELQLEPRPAQSTRLIKTYCHICRYTARITRVWLDRGGPPFVRFAGSRWRKNRKASPKIGSQRSELNTCRRTV